MQIERAIDWGIIIAHLALLIASAGVLVVVYCATGSEFFKVLLHTESLIKTALIAAFTTLMLFMHLCFKRFRAWIAFLVMAWLVFFGVYWYALS